MAPENGEDEIARLRSEIAELRRSFNQFVRAQAALVAALRQAEESSQSRHHLLLRAIGDLRSLALAETARERVVVTDDAVPLAVKSKDEVTGRFKVGGISVRLDGEGRHFRDLVFRVGKWVALLLGMALSGGIGWLIGIVKNLNRGP